MGCGLLFKEEIIPMFMENVTIMSSETFSSQLWLLLSYSCILSVGGTGNAIVVIVILRSNKVTKTAPFNVLIFVLAIVDFLLAVILLPNYVLSTTYKPRSDQGTEDLFCRAVAGYFIPFWLCLLSVLLLTLIGLERRNAVLNPFSTLERGKFVSTLMKVLFVLAASLVVEIPSTFGMYHDNANPSVGNFCAYSYTQPEVIAIFSVIFLFHYIIPLSVFLVSFVQIRRRLLADFLSLKSLMAAYKKNIMHERMLSRLLARKKRTIQTTKLVIFAFFVCVTPNEILYALFQFADVKTVSWNTKIYQIGVLLKFSSCCVNPILYSFYSSQFRRNFRDAFPLLFGRCRGVIRPPVVSANLERFNCCDNLEVAHNQFAC